MIDVVNAVAFFLFAVPASVVDVREHRIPDALSMPAIAVLLLTAIISWPASFEHLATGAFAFVLFHALRLARPSGLGGGDVKAAIAMGLLLGAAGFVVSVLVACLSALIWALVRYCGFRSARAQAIPFMPFLSFGALVALVAGPHLPFSGWIS